MAGPSQPVTVDGGADLYVPLIAAFTDDSSTLSEVRIARVVRHHVELEAQGFLVNGDTGDFFLLSLSERKQMVEWVMRESHGRPVWVNVTAMTTSAAVDLAQHAARHGARGVVVCPPQAGRYFDSEAKSLLASVQRHGNITAVFADPERKWEAFHDSLPLERVSAPDHAVLASPAPDEMVVENAIVTPLTMFGASRVKTILSRPDVLVPAMGLLVKRGGLSRAARAALEKMGLDVGTSRGPMFELADDGREVLNGIARLLGV
ncbi:MAG TPA: dihydrodipicolinate synthase family protein [Fimbriimonadaceae bacterium]|nr:dihydrodipicolinate synthase family protein [Fimbriimonadaceae bacterium]